MLPRGVLRGLRDAARGDAWGAARAAAIAVGFATTATGFAAGWMSGIGRPLLGNPHGRQPRAIERRTRHKPARAASAGGAGPMTAAAASECRS